MVKSIKFSSKYAKMLNNLDVKIPKEAILFEVFRKKTEDLDKSFLFYDTLIEGPSNSLFTHYNIPHEEVIVLILFTKNNFGGRGMLWTTIRRYTPEKHDYYMKQRGKTFNIEMLK